MTATERDKAREELQYLEEWLQRLERDHPGLDMSLSKAGIRKMISRIRDELAEYEQSRKV